MENLMKNSILIVDDEKSNLLVLNGILNQDYTLYLARDGKEALERANEYMPDLILLDILMPGMDGYETLEKLKSSHKTKDIPIIFITGLSNVEDQVKGLGCDVADYITKPFSRQIITLRIRNHMKIINSIHEIERLSMTDQLTNIPNRHYFNSQLEAAWKLSVRTRQSLSIIILDIDHFKKYNDIYGHQQGDVALREAACIMAKSLHRASDLIARYGGEEFIVLLPDTCVKGALKVAERMRSNIEEAEILHWSAKFDLTKLTISLGVNSLTPKHEDSIDIFISCADDALYMSKNNGRNRVSVYKPAD